MSHPDINDTDDGDTLHILPLRMIPLKNTRLQRARIVKNARLDGVIEIFSDRTTGSGQIDPISLMNALTFTEEEMSDVQTVQNLALLPSYDVYSLRIGLRNLEIPLSDVRDLQLSSSKRIELSRYMQAFTKPLFQVIYGKVPNTTSIQEIIDMFTNPDVEIAKKNLHHLSNVLNVPIREIPTFLENYGDIYLSLAYYQQILDKNFQRLNEFLDEMTAMLKNRIYKDEPGLKAACVVTKTTLTDVVTEAANILDIFEKRTFGMWEDISAEKFREISNLINSYHVRMGGALCIIDVKMRAWAERFPDRDRGSMSQRANFIVSDMKCGLEKLEMAAA